MLLLTHHKCASTWLHAYLTACCKANQLSLWTSHLSAVTPDPGADIACLVNARYDLARTLPGPKLHIIRNPLDLVVSAYHSHLSTHALDGWPQLAEQRVRLSALDQAAGMQATIAFLERIDFYPGAVGPLRALGEWEFEDAFMTTLRMEDVVAANGAPIGEWLAAKVGVRALPDPAAFTFERFSGRRAGHIDEASHYRSGLAGTWRSELPAASIAYLREAYHGILSRFYPELLD